MKFKMEEVKIYEKIDEKQITQRIKCDYPNCEEYALMLVGKMWLCGKHVIEYHKFKTEKEKEEFFKNGN